MKWVTNNSTKTPFAYTSCCCYQFSGAPKYFPSYNCQNGFQPQLTHAMILRVSFKVRGASLCHIATAANHRDPPPLWANICIVLQLSLQLKHHYSPPRYRSGRRGFILKIEGVLQATIILEFGPFGRPKTSLFLSSLPFLSSWAEAFRLFSFTVDLWLCQGCLGAIYHRPGSSGTLTH